MSGDILDLIDGAIEAHETSDDAMRWAPEPVDIAAYVKGVLGLEMTAWQRRVAAIFDVPPAMLDERRRRPRGA